MGEHVAELLKKALTLPPEARAALAGALLDSLEEDVLDEGVEADWGAEIARRVQELSLGRVGVLPWTEVRRRLTIPQKMLPKPVEFHSRLLPSR